MIRISPYRLQQLLNNLISNAIKFSFPHTEISVELSLVDGMAVLVVRDQGQGNDVCLYVCDCVRSFLCFFLYVSMLRRGVCVGVYLCACLFLKTCTHIWQSEILLHRHRFIVCNTCATYILA